jgi:hypothetical protein
MIVNKLCLGVLFGGMLMGVLMTLNGPGEDHIAGAILIAAGMISLTIIAVFGKNKNGGETK